MICGVNLGILLVCLLQAVSVCCSRASQEDEGLQTRINMQVGLPLGSSSFVGRRPQDKFRQVNVFKNNGHFTRAAANQELYNQQYAHTASESRHKAYPIKYLKGSNVDSSNGDVPPRQAFGLSSPTATRSSVSKHDTPNQQSVLGMTLPGQQSALRTGQYAPSNSDFQSSLEGSNYFPSGVRQPVAWKPNGAAKMHQKPSSNMEFKLPGPDKSGSLKPPKEYVQATSGLARGRKVRPNGGSRKQTPQLPTSRYFSLGQSSQVSAYNQNPQLFTLQTGMNPAPMPMRGYELYGGRLGPGQRFAPTKIHNIPQQFGGFAIKRLGDEESMKDGQWKTTEMPVTLKPAKTYTFPPRPMGSFKPQPQRVHEKSKWMMIRSNQLMGAPVVFGDTL